MRDRLVLGVALYFFAAAVPAMAQDVDELLLNARKLLTEHKAAEALPLIDKALAKNAKDPRVFLIRGLAHDAIEKYADAVVDFTKVLKLDDMAAEAYNLRGVSYFKLGEMNKSLADFDRYLERRPKARPYHWQRGICCYYAGKFAEGNKQFEEHQTVNASDVENAVWRYLCQARLIGLDKARVQMLTIREDERVPMMEIYDLFLGKRKAEDVVKAAQAKAATPSLARRQMFYAHLYLGLYYESQGDTKKAREHIESAAGEYRIPEYMGDVARVHRDWLKHKDK